MPFFNLRRGGSASPSTAGLAAPAESLEVVRKRAKHRLIGSAVLVLLGVIGFPLLFDTQPRPVAVNIPIEIPSKQGAKNPSPAPASQSPLVAAAVPETAPAAGSAPAEASPTPASAQAPVAATKEATREAPKETPKAAELPASVPAPVPAAATTVPVTAPTTAPKADEGARAKSLLEGKASSEERAANTTASERLVVQVGAFADAGKAREARLKLEKAGLKTYTQVAETKDGKRIRVRVGPFDKKADADKAAKQIKALDLPAAILTL